MCVSHQGHLLPGAQKSEVFEDWGHRWEGSRVLPLAQPHGTLGPEPHRPLPWPAACCSLLRPPPSAPAPEGCSVQGSTGEFTTEASQGLTVLLGGPGLCVRPWPASASPAPPAGPWRSKEEEAAVTSRPWSGLGTPAEQGQGRDRAGAAPGQGLGQGRSREGAGMGLGQGWG